MTHPSTFPRPTSPVSPPDPYTPIVARHLRIEDITWGLDQDSYLVRYRGKLYRESSKSYNQVASSLRQLDVTPLFRQEGNSHAIVLVRGVVRPRPSNPIVNLVFFIVTLLSVLFSGTFSVYDGPFTTDLGVMLPHLIPAILSGLAFAGSILGILLAHEFGHYIAARYHRTAVTLPYFIPFPLSPFGTMGAFIQLKEPPKNKRILLDIGIAGPLAGLVVAIPLLIIGLSLSNLETLPSTPPPGLILEGNSILYLIIKYAVFGEWLPGPTTYAGLHPLIYWIRYYFTGLPVPLGGIDVMLHPIAWAGWAGLLVTALNLIPAGQLDGGHVLYVLLGQKARAVLPFILVSLIVLGVVWPGWWLWAFLIFVIGRFHAEPLDQITELDPRRKSLALLGLIVFILVFIPVPLRLFGV